MAQLTTLFEKCIQSKSERSTKKTAVRRYGEKEAHRLTEERLTEP